MKNLFALAILMFSFILGACSQGTAPNPQPPKLLFDPTGSYSGAMVAQPTGATQNVTISIFTVPGEAGWHAIFIAGGPVTAKCGQIEGKSELLCASTTINEVLIWEGPLTNNAWTGEWTYTSTGVQLEGTFNFTRQ